MNALLPKTEANAQHLDTVVDDDIDEFHQHLSHPYGEARARDDAKIVERSI